MNDTPAIRVKSLVNRFGRQLVHDNLSFEISQGEIIGIVGGSGSGKSVLMRSIIGLQQPKEGEIFILGNRRPDGECTDARDVGVLFQQGALFSSLTVLQNVMIPLQEHADASRGALQELAMQKILLAGLPPESAAKFPSELSGGMIKRAALARALALDPHILFLDEPTAGLDPIAAAKFDELVKDLQKSLGLTIVIITHDLDTLFSICDRIAVLVDKKIIVDTLQNLLEHKHPWIYEYFHGPRARAVLDGKG
ncbi:MAG: ATP-binding cassette domain-containing protein [Rickettsiales bacterium]